MKALLLGLCVLAACGGDDGGSSPADAAGSGSDAAPIDGASANKVVTVACPATPDATVTTAAGGSSFMPASTTVAVGGVVKFVMSSDHNVAPNPIAANKDAGTVVGYGATACLKFTAAGTFGIYCSAHSFAGTITVQ